MFLSQKRGLGGGKKLDSNTNVSVLGKNPHKGEKN